MHGTFEQRGERAKLDDKSLLAKLRNRGQISEAEYQVGDKMRVVYWKYLGTIGAPCPYGLDDLAIAEADSDNCQDWADAARGYLKVLDSVGRRARDAVLAVAVYEDSEELGDFEYTARAAQKGLAALVLVY